MLVIQKKKQAVHKWYISLNTPRAYVLNAYLPLPPMNGVASERSDLMSHLLPKTLPGHRQHRPTREGDGLWGHTNLNSNPSKLFNLSDLQFYLMQFWRDHMTLHVQNTRYIIIKNGNIINITGQSAAFDVVNYSWCLETIYPSGIWESVLSEHSPTFLEDSWSVL